MVKKMTKAARAAALNVLPSAPAPAELAIVWEAPACPGCQTRFDPPGGHGVSEALVTVTCDACGQQARARFWRRQEA